MNEIQPIPVRSVRLAKARITKNICQTQKPLKLETKDQFDLKIAIESFSDKSNEKSTSYRDKITPKPCLNIAENDLENPFKMKIILKQDLKELFTDDYPAEVAFCRKNVFEGELLKRIKTELITDYFNDRSDFAYIEISEFERIYSEILFDNSIYKSPQRQADLNVLSNKKFKTYKKQNFATTYTNNSNQFKRSIQYIQLIANKDKSLMLTDSKIRVLMELCETEPIFYKFVHEEEEILLQFFGRGKEKTALDKTN